MLTVTHDAIGAIKAVTGPAEAGVRISAAPHSVDGNRPGLLVVPAPGPAPADAVLDVTGAQLYLNAAAATMLDCKVLDADEHDGAVRFVVLDPP